MNRRQKKKQISKQRKQDAKIWEGLFNYYLKVQWGRKGKKWRKNTRKIVRMICNESMSGVHLHYAETPEDDIVIDLDLSARKDKNEQATEKEIKETN